ncbi:MAG: RNA polymerase sigma factor [Pseudomonadota bacterium]
MTSAGDPFPELGDEAVLELYAGGDAQAAACLTARLAPRILSHCQRRLGDRSEAEDVVQDAMFKLWQIAPSWEPGRAKLSTWLFQVASNLCVDRLRRRRSVGLDEIAEPVDNTPSVETRLMQTSRLNALETALEKLPDRQKQAVLLRHIEGLSNPEIGEIMDLSVEAVESLTARGKRALAGLLSRRKEELGL